LEGFCMTRRCIMCGKRKGKSRINPRICVRCMRNYPSLRDQYNVSLLF